MTETADTIPIDVAPVEIAQRRTTSLPAQREVVFDIQDLTASYGTTAAITVLAGQTTPELEELFAAQPAPVAEIGPPGSCHETGRAAGAGSPTAVN